MGPEYDLDGAIRKVPDFPKPGVLFYDITGILVNPEAFNHCIERMIDLYKDTHVTAVAAIEARGFVFASPFAARRKLPLILIRKKNKLPGETYSRRFALEYGEDEIEVHKADIRAGQSVLLVDDLIATGGTLRAACALLEEGRARVAGIFSVVGLPFLHYEKLLAGYPVQTLIQYRGE